MRYYYDGDLPAIIQVGEHQFVERRLVNMWCMDTNIAWYVYILNVHGLANLYISQEVFHKLCPYL